MLSHLKWIYDVLTAPYISLEKSKDYLTRLTALFMLFMLSLIALPMLLLDSRKSYVQSMMLNTHFFCVIGVYFLARFGKLKIASELLVWLSVISPTFLAFNGQYHEASEIQYLKDFSLFIISITLAQFILSTWELLTIVAVCACLVISSRFWLPHYPTSSANAFLLCIILCCGLVSAAGSVLTTWYRDKVKMELVSTISHQLRTPLHAIISCVELISKNQKYTREQKRELLKSALYSGKEMLNIVNNILDCARLKEGDITICKSVFSLKDILMDVICDLDEKAKEKGIKTKIDVPTKNYYLYGDGERIQQVLKHLVSNSIKFTSSGYIHLTVQVDISGSNAKLRCTVEDTGIGIPATHVPKLFTQIVKLPTGVSGSGLGLRICYELIKLMNGHIELVWSKPGIGSKFFFEVPIGIDETKIPSPSKNWSRKYWFSQPLTILLAEDEKVLRSVTVQMLKSMNCNIDVVENGKCCVEMYFKNPGKYDCILMDLKMPQSEGITAAETIMKKQVENQLKPIALVALSADNSPEMIANCKRKGFKFFLAKPFTRCQLYKLLKNVHNKL